MSKIKYKLDGVRLLTDCPRGKKTPRGYAIKVGSGTCRECSQFLGDDMRGIVECNDEDGQES